MPAGSGDNVQPRQVGPSAPALRPVPKTRTWSFVTLVHLLWDQCLESGARPSPGEVYLHLGIPKPPSYQAQDWDVFESIEFINSTCAQILI